MMNAKNVTAVLLALSGLYLAFISNAPAPAEQTGQVPAVEATDGGGVSGATVETEVPDQPAPTTTAAPATTTTAAPAWEYPNNLPPLPDGLEQDQPDPCEITALITDGHYTVDTIAPDPAAVEWYAATCADLVAAGHYQTIDTIAPDPHGPCELLAQLDAGDLTGASDEQITDWQTACPSN